MIKRNPPKNRGDEGGRRRSQEILGAEKANQKIRQTDIARGVKAVPTLSV